MFKLKLFLRLFVSTLLVLRCSGQDFNFQDAYCYRHVSEFQLQTVKLVDVARDWTSDGCECDIKNEIHQVLDGWMGAFKTVKTVKLFNYSFDDADSRLS